jgi:hypothetical protein
MVFLGPSAIVLGGLGWMAVRATLLPLRVPKITFILLGTLTGAVVGGCFEIIYRFAADLGLENPVAVWTWVIASVAGGAAGGFIVGYYASKSVGTGRPEMVAGGPATHPAQIDVRLNPPL